MNMSNIVDIHVQLLNEGSPTARPAQAIVLAHDRYYIASRLRS